MTWKQYLAIFLDKTDWMKTLAGVTILVAFLFQVYFLAFHTIPEGNEPMFHTIFGMIDVNMVTLFQYYFGSSKGSQDKQKTIDKQNEKVNP